MEQELRRMFEMKETEMSVPPTLSPELRNRVGRQRMIMGGLVAAAALALVVGGFAGARSLSSDRAIPPAGPSPNGAGDVSGWITYGNKRGIWAFDLTSSGDAADVVQLSSKPGSPQAWSPDGSKLLVLREVKDSDPRVFERDLFVLNSDGTETRLAQADDGGDFTPDGSRVVYGDGANIYVIDAEGGTPKLLLAAGTRRYPDEAGRLEGQREGSFTVVESSLYQPSLSPDGSQIAYFDGMGDWGHSLRVMNSNGTGTRVVLENRMTMVAGHVAGLDWSPDGQHLVFALDSHGVYVVGIDGSGLVSVSSEECSYIVGTARCTDEADPHWSPDGSLISYNTGDPLWAFDSLVIARTDGTRVQELDHGRSGPWIPDSEFESQWSEFQAPE